MKLLLMADTHVPKRARDLPEQLWHAVDGADVVVHAGDWVCVKLLDALLARTGQLIGVVGNNDGPPLQARLPEIATAQLDGVRLAVIHDTGPANGRETRCAARFPDTDVLVFGHSHIPWDTVAPTGLRLLNPGSPTDRRRQPSCSWMTAEISGGRLGEVRLHRLSDAAASKASRTRPDSSELQRDAQQPGQHEGGRAEWAERNVGEVEHEGER